jgi:hypothetical protein
LINILDSLYEDDLNRYDAETETMKTAAKEREAERERKREEEDKKYQLLIAKEKEGSSEEQPETELSEEEALENDRAMERAFEDAMDFGMDDHYQEMQQLRAIDDRVRNRNQFRSARTAPVLQSFGTVDFMESLEGHTRGGHSGYVTGLRFDVEKTEK